MYVLIEPRRGERDWSRRDLFARARSKASQLLKDFLDCFPGLQMIRFENFLFKSAIRSAHLIHSLFLTKIYLGRGCCLYPPPLLRSIQLEPTYLKNWIVYYV